MRAPSRGTRIIERTDSATLLVPAARLVVHSGPDAGSSVTVGASTLTVGSGAEADFVLHDESVSRRHFELTTTSDGVVLRDLRSTNGTEVDGVRALEVIVAPPARIVVGASVLQLVVDGAEEVEIPLSRRTSFGALLGHAPAMRAAFATLEKLAGVDTSVLLLGESGTGKELAARALHERSPRAAGPYVVLDAGALPPTLAEAHLFGHARGAFTGAEQARAGVFEAADGGTLVLDEIGELPLELQPKLLRALEARTIQRLGETEVRRFDVRFVASTNRNLAEDVRGGRFRQDLLFRLSVATVRLPPLRERREEIPRLVASFLQKAKGVAPPELPPSLLRLLQAYDWPGNVRELRNFVERYEVLGADDATALLPGMPAMASTPPPAVSPLPFHEAKQLSIDHFERHYLEQLLARCGGNISEVARTAGLARQTCYRLLEKHGLRSA